MQPLHEAKECGERLRIIEVRRLVAELPVDLCQRRRAKAPPCPRQGRCARSTVSPRSKRNSGVSVLRASVTGANAETISETGAVTALATPLSDHVVRIDIESLPTGIDRPIATHVSMATARTVS